MNAFKTALLGASLLVAASAAASAADVYKRDGGFKDEPSYQPAITSWAGFYAGVHAGATFGDELELVVDVEDIGEASASDDVDSAFVGGIHVGYNWQRNSNLVLGVEASLSLLGDEIEDTDLTEYLASLRGRIGYGTNDTLFYATGGVAFLKYADEFIDGADEETAVGFVVGAGIERKLTSNISIGVEGLYYDFSSDIGEFEVGDTTGDAELERNFWTVQARLNYHFNSGSQEPLK